MDNRESIDIYYMKMAYLVSTRSTCVKRQVGCVITKDNLQVSAGYNGSPSKIEHCTLETCLRKNIPSGEKLQMCRACHSEMSAISQAARKGISTEGAYLYCTTFPCLYCAKAIVNAGITQIFYCESYGEDQEVNKLTKEILQNIKVTQIKKEDIL
jgi:dCMP deaminase